MSTAAIRWISGPVLRATMHGSFFLRECVRVGPRALLGEVVRIDGDEITVQVYEDTTGLRPGTLIEGERQPLAVRVGPALLGNIFDGLLRPLTGVDARVLAGNRPAPPARLAFRPECAAGEVGARLLEYLAAGEGGARQRAGLAANEAGAPT